MTYLAKQKNELKERFETEALDRRSGQWKDMDAKDAAPSFPIFSDTDLRNSILGVYQIKLAKSYTQEYLNDGDCMISVNDDIQSMLRVRIQSRDVSSKTLV